MADWYGSARSNYFRVKDLKAFQELCSRWGVSFMTKSESEPELVGFVCETEFGGLPSHIFEEVVGTDELKEYEFDDFLKELAGLLKDGEVAIMMEAGAEKLRYITGCAVAVNSKGRTVSVSLDDIYKKAKKLGGNITPVEY
jgi:hypothetical protein